MRCEWVAAEVEPRPSFRALLTGQVRPLVEQFFVERIVRRFHFERSSHLRLCFLLNDGSDAPLLCERIEHRAFDVVSFERSRPRLVDLDGAAIAEEQFDASSRVVMQLLSREGEWTANRAIATAASMHLGLAFALGLKRCDASALFGEVAYEALASQPRFLGHRLDLHATANAFAELEVRFAARKDTHVPQLVALWLAMTDRAEVEPWLGEWILAMRRVRAHLESMHWPRATLWTAIGAYIRGTNNRLGIDDEDAPYLAYLLKRSLEIV